MALKVSWIKNGNSFRRVEGDVSNVEKLPVGIYSVDFNPLGGWSLEYTAERFHFDYKVYGLQTSFIDHVLYAFEHTSGNLGILLNGTKGTGKTVTAKILANKLNLPIVIAKSFGENNQGLIEYLSSFNFDCIFFFDEFEKNFSDKDCSILQIMDGVYNSAFRRIFLLTTNETTINENLLSRPSRLRYVKEFNNLEREVVIEYLEDNLLNKSDKDGLMSFIDTLQISTIDILKTIVEECNIFGYEKFMSTKEFFNVKTAEYCYYALRTSLDSRLAPNYPIEEFLKDVKKEQNRKEPIRFLYESEEKWREDYQRYVDGKDRPRLSFNHLTVDSDRSVKYLKPGDSFGYYDGEVVKSIDIKKSVVITEDDDNTTYYYYIKNMNASPSLYGKTYAYGGYNHD